MGCFCCVKITKREWSFYIADTYGCRCSDSPYKRKQVNVRTRDGGLHRGNGLPAIEYSIQKNKISDLKGGIKNFV